MHTTDDAEESKMNIISKISMNLIDTELKYIPVHEYLHKQ